MSARRASSRSGKSAIGSAPSRTSAWRRPSAAAASIPAVSSPRAFGAAPQWRSYQARAESRVTRPGSIPGARPRSRAPRTLPRRRAARNATPGTAREHRTGGLDDRLVGFGQRGATEDDDGAGQVPREDAAGGGNGRDGHAGDVVVGVGVGEESGGERCHLTRTVHQRAAHEVRERRGPGGELHDAQAGVEDRASKPQVQHGQLFFEIGGDQDHGRRRACVGDRRLREAQHHLGGEAVAELGVHVVGLPHALGQLRPRVALFVGEPGAADDTDRLRPVLGDDLRQLPAGGGQRLAPRCLHQLGAVADERSRQAVLAVDPAEVVAAAVAQPRLVDRLRVEALVAGDAVGGRFDGDAAADGTARARAVDALDIPGPGREPVRRGRERTDRTELDHVAREVRRERVVGEGVDLRRVASADEVDERVAGHLLAEAGATVAEDAPLAVEQHERGDLDRLGEVALLLDEAALARTEAEGLVLERALAALVADRAVERVVDEEELEHPVLGLLDAR